jgi:hypothetical protein
LTAVLANQPLLSVVGGAYQTVGLADFHIPDRGGDHNAGQRPDPRDSRAGRRDGRDPRGDGRQPDDLMYTGFGSASVFNSTQTVTFAT